MNARKRWPLYLVSIWVALLVIGSLLPDPLKHLLHTSEIPHRHGDITTHKIVHLCAFGTTTLLLLLVANTTRQRLLAVATVCSLGLLTEYLEAIVYRTPFEWADLRTDGAAVLLALPVYTVFLLGTGQHQRPRK